MNRGSFNNSIIHRSVPGFIFQGGGYQWLSNTPVAIPSDPAVRNEYGVSNTRGTLAMAKLGNDPNSATNQWFFNLGNNASNLNNQNGGFTVFGRVADAASLAVMDKIAAVPVPNPPIFNSPFDAMPLINFKGGTVTTANLVLVLSVTQLETPPSITANGIITAGSFGGFQSASPGSFIEIYGANLAGNTRGWATSDFTEGNAPTALDGVSVHSQWRARLCHLHQPHAGQRADPGERADRRIGTGCCHVQGLGQHTGDARHQAVCGRTPRPAHFQSRRQAVCRRGSFE